MAIDAGEFRKVMSNFATGVTIVTTRVGDMLHGITANAVSSVSLDPLLFLVCIDKSANAHAELERAEHFGVSILSAAQEDVSNTFASSAEPERGTLRGVPFRTGETGVPLVEGAVACMECEVSERVDAGDHTIILGLAVAGEVHDDGPPLLYFRGKYRKLAL